MLTSERSQCFRLMDSAGGAQRTPPYLVISSNLRTLGLILKKYMDMKTIWQSYLSKTVFYKV